jgi:predicted enzyme related to lactoylglutathione lyase
MPALPSSNPAQFVQGAPVLHVADVEATAAFYRDVLGFTWDFGDETYAVVWRDNSTIHFVRDMETQAASTCFSGSRMSTLTTEK